MIHGIMAVVEPLEGGEFDVDVVELRSREEDRVGVPLEVVAAFSFAFFLGLMVQLSFFSATALEGCGDGAEVEVDDAADEEMVVDVFFRVEENRGFVAADFPAVVEPLEDEYIPSCLSFSLVRSTCSSNSFLASVVDGGSSFTAFLEGATATI